MEVAVEDDLAKVEKKMDEFLVTNQGKEDNWSPTDSFLKKPMNFQFQRDHFQMSLEATLRINSELNLKSLEEEDEKVEADKSLQHHWNHGNGGLLRSQSPHLESGEAKITFQEVKAVVLKMSRQIQDCAAASQGQQGQTTKLVLEQRAKLICNYVNGKGSVMTGVYLELHAKLLETLEEALNSVPNEDFIGWAERLDKRLKFSFSQYETDQNGNGIGLASTLGNEPIKIKMEKETCNDQVAAGTQKDGIDMLIEQTTQRFDLLKTNSMNPKDDLILEGGGKRDQSFTLPASKRFKQLPQDEEDEKSFMSNENENDWNVPSENGDYPLLRAIREGESIKYIKKMLEKGVNVNVKSQDDRQVNAAYETIQALIDNKVTSKKAFDILNHLMNHGFTLINDGDSEGFTPLLLAMELQNMNEEFLEWFHKNKADFNALTEENGDTPLFHAIWKRQIPGIIRKIIELGGNPKHVNKWKENALHVSARHGNASAMEIFLDEFKLDMNEVDEDRDTPLHLLFSENGLDHDYSKCLKLLLDRGADFTVKCRVGYVPLVNWIMNCEGDIFPVLMKFKDLMPITPGIASAALTVIVEEMDRLQNFLPCLTRGGQSDFAQFITFLVKEKEAKLLLRDEDAWEELEWGKLEKEIFTRNVLNELKKNGVALGKGKLIKILPTNLGMIDMLDSRSETVSVRIEIMLVCLLACRRFEAFVEVCRVVERFCIAPRASK